MNLSIRVRADYAKELKGYYPRRTHGINTSFNDIIEAILVEKRNIKKLQQLQKSKEELIAENERLIKANDELIITKNMVAESLNVPL